MVPSSLLSPPVQAAGLSVEAKAAQLADFYTAEDWATVKSHLRRDPDTVLLLTEAQEYLKHIFGENIKVALDVVQEMEEGEAAMLFARVQPDGDWQISFDKMDRFDEEWWVDTSSCHASRLEFSIAF